MKKYYAYIVMVMACMGSIQPVLGAQVYANNSCFLAQEKGKVLYKEGNCDVRNSPCSTFKIAISLMGYDARILIDDTHPEWPFKPGYMDLIDVWKQPQNPTSWMRTSCVWYSQKITAKLGVERFKQYVTLFDYGNNDVSGGVSHAWLMSSLRISAAEQLAFVQKVIDNKLPVSRAALEKTKKLLYVETLQGGWKLYGKQGGGFVTRADGSFNMERPLGWFVGWIEKDGRSIAFVQFVEDGKKRDVNAGVYAQEQGAEKVLLLMAGR